MRSYLTFYTLIRLLIVAGVVITFLWYIAFQARLLIAGPSITLTNNLPQITSSKVLSVEGSVDNVVEVTLNGRAIFVNQEGYFKETLVLENGYTIMTLEARDRYERIRTITQSVVYQGTS